MAATVATVMRMADRCMFISLGLRPTNISIATCDWVNESILADCDLNELLGARFVPLTLQR